MECWPPAPLPARRAYRPEGSAYGSESATCVKQIGIAAISLELNQSTKPMQIRSGPGSNAKNINIMGLFPIDITKCLGYRQLDYKTKVHNYETTLKEVRAL